MRSQFDITTIYDTSHSWMNANDRVAWERVIDEDPGEGRKMGEALITADPNTPNALISNNMTAWRIPPRYGYDPEEFDIMDVIELSGDDNIGHLNDFAPTDFSATRAGRESTSYPSLPMF